MKLKGKTMFLNGDQFAAWKRLLNAIDEAPTRVGCDQFPDAFYPEKGGDAAWIGPLARKLCDNCPVKELCGDYGLKFEQYGIWGGMPPKTRQRLRNRLGIRLPD
jgi:WhiB family redox-sensing transcriptional regulator